MPCVAPGTCRCRAYASRNFFIVANALPSGLVADAHDRYQRWIDEERTGWQTFLRAEEIDALVARAFGLEKLRGVGRGVVIIGGRQHVASTNSTDSRRTYYTLDALIAAVSLRRVGCTLPVEIWHDHDPALLGEDGDIARAALGGLMFRDLELLPGSHTFHGVDLASLVLLHTSFEEVLYLDADVVAASDPASLFDVEQYSSTGTLFWPTQDPHNPTMQIIWEVLRCDPAPYKADNAVMLIHRGRHYVNLELAHYFNQRWRPLRYGYPFFLNGDADMFEFSWLATSTPFYRVLPPADIIGSSTREFPFCGHSIFIRHPNRTQDLVFVHRARNKFSVTSTAGMRSNAIKRSRVGVLQGEEVRGSGGNKRQCFDFYGVIDGRYNVVQSDTSAASLETLRSLQIIEDELFALRGWLAGTTSSSASLSPGWATVLAKWRTFSTYGQTGQ